MSWTSNLAESIGAPESGLKLILGQLAGYPIFLFYRFFLRRNPSWHHHLYFLLTGLWMAWWALGADAVMHGAICVAVTYFAIKIAGPTYVTTAFLFVFNIMYLFVGYIFNATREYDITWTMPQCVICLRLIGLAMDVWDGTKDKNTLGKDQQAAALDKLPSLLECFSHSFFIGGYFVGPQFSMKKFQTFIQRNQSETDLPSPVAYGFGRLALGLIYMLMHLVGSIYFPESYVMTPEFAALGFLKKSVFFWFWVKAILAKYIAAWLFAEGACVISGIAYNGVDENTKNVKWNGIANVRFMRFETCLKFQHLIESFNINTNAWVMSYVYKRLRFLNNKLMSQLGVLVFLAIWHGYHSGYYITFFNEFCVMFIEKEFLTAMNKIPSMRSFVNENPVGQLVSSVFGWLYVQCLLPHSFLCFALLKADKYMVALKAVNYFLYVYIVVGLIVVNVMKNMTREKRKKEEKEK